MNQTRLAVLLTAALSVASAVAQSEAPKAKSSEFYRLKFVLKEMEGTKTVKTHSYQTMMASNGFMSSVRSGAKIPVSDGKGTSYIDVGVNVDVRQLIKTKEGLELDIVVDASGVLDTGTGSPSAKSPVIDQTKWTSKVEIPIGTPTTVFSSDDPSSKHQLELEVTATPVHQ